MSGAETLRRSLAARLAEARARTDELFALLQPGALYERPIPERHRLLFYLGHLEAFDWNMICRSAFQRHPFQEDFDRLFAFGIDPVNGNLPTESPSDWPPLGKIRHYCLRVRHTVDDCLKQAAFSATAAPEWQDGLIFHVDIEHRLMHAETLTYLLHQLPFESLHNRSILPEPAAQAPVQPQSVEIPAGSVTLGLRRSPATPFGWDNEFQSHIVEVPAFAIDVYPVTNGQFLEFVCQDGYQERSLWREKDWRWKSQQQLEHPRFWRRQGERWFYRALFAEVPLPLDWPVFVSQAEAAAYARWRGRALPTEAQWHRAAYGTADGRERTYPWGEEPPLPRHGNFDFSGWNPTPVGAHPAGRSFFGVADLAGNGWEWTSTEFAAFPGFQPFPFYPGYSAEFFDGRHYVVKGGSARTAACLLRRSFRNWFQPHYPYIHATFRCVEN